MSLTGTALCRRDDGRATYFSLKPSQTASASGWWTTDVKKALRFASSVDAIDFAKTFLRSDEPFLAYIDLSQEQLA